MRTFNKPISRPNVTPALLQKGRELIDDAGTIAILTGAGISTDSGIPDFRGPRGVWTLSPQKEQDSNINSYMMSEDIRRRGWGSGGINRLGDLKPNEGHKALVSLADKTIALVTQNIDGLHQAAGFPADKVVEAHGNSRQCACCICGEVNDIKYALDQVWAGDLDPRCGTCGGPLKANVVFFGETLDQGNLIRMWDAAWDCDLLLVVGTSLKVPPVREMVPQARSKGATVVILNQQSTELDHLSHLSLRGSISEILPQLV